MAAGFIAPCLAMLMSCGASSRYTAFITPSSVLLVPGQTYQFQIATAEPQSPVLLVNGVAGGSSSTGTITPAGLYTAPSSASAQPIIIGIRGQASSATVTLLNPANLSGSVAATQNPLVASYSLVIPTGASAQVQFGPDTTYGFPTSFVQSATGGTVTILVAGMRASTTYHMQAVIDLPDGSQLLDTDHTFTTGSIPADQLPNLTATFAGVGTPSPGVELFSLFPESAANLLSTVATDLEGNVIWYYNLSSYFFPEPVKPMPNGHMLVNVMPDGPPQGPQGSNQVLEVDLAGNIINTATIPAVNQALAGIGADFQFSMFHHDVAVLPNGHWILLVNFSETINDVAGIPQGTVMLGDALIDWDPQQGTAGWIWNTFDHLDLTHAPYGFKDWTHSNAIIYSPTDGNLILSLRNQNWIIKINYNNGAGDGSILWTLGPGGDFTLPPGQAPIEWNYGQHGVRIVGSNSAGVFSLMFFNNGNNRLMDSNNDVCGSPGVGACYSSVPVFQLDESAKTATVLWEDNLLPSYSICCGDAFPLDNGNYEFDVALDVNTPGFSHIEEVTPSQDLVWKMDVEGQLAYRGFRIPSLYPGQTWPATTPLDSKRVFHSRVRGTEDTAGASK